MSDLDPLEKLRVQAALGQSVTMGADTIRAILTAFRNAERIQEDARVNLRSASHTLNASLANLIVSIVYCLAVIAAVVWVTL